MTENSKPVSAGWYWVKRSANESFDEIFFVDDNLNFYISDDTYLKVNEDFTKEWIWHGPIQEPNDQRHETTITIGGNNDDIDIDIEKIIEEINKMTCAHEYGVCSGKCKEDAETECDLDKQMENAGMVPVSEMLERSAFGVFSAHAGVTDLEKFEQWIQMRRGEFIRMQAQMDLENKQNEELYEWVVAHNAVLAEVMSNFRQATGRNP